MQQCSKCRRIKYDHQFYPDPSRKSGFSSYCEVCSKARCADRYKRNKETHNAKCRAYYESHKTEVNLMCAKWVAKHKEKVKAYQKEYIAANKPAIRMHKEKWRKNNRHKIAAKENRRRSLRLEATPFWADKDKIAEFYKLAHELNRSGIKYHVDHIVPLKSKFVCGLHVETNLAIIPADENAVKGNRHWPHKFGEYDPLIGELLDLAFSNRSSFGKNQ